MKVFKRSNLPDSITYNGKVFILDIQASTDHSMKKIKPIGKYVFVDVLSSGLKGKTDLHNLLYKPNRWVFLIQKIKP